MGTEVLTLDPHDVTDNPSAMAVLHLYEGLTRLTPAMEVVPGLAESWSSSPDGLTWRFRLRRGISFHDGTPLDAAAVKASLERLVSPSEALARRSLLAPLLAEVRTEGDREVVLRLSRPSAALPRLLAHTAGSIVSPRALAAWGKGIARHPSGTGPFRFLEWVPGDRLVLERNPHYWDRDRGPFIDLLVFRPVPEAASRAMLLETGQVEAAYPVSPVDFLRLAGKPRLRMVAEPSQRVVYVGINTRRPPLDDLRVRKALNYAVDREGIVEKLLMGLGSPADSPLAPSPWGHASTVRDRYDPGLAAALLAQAGVPRGTPLELWAPSGRYLMDRHVAEAVHGFLAAVGFRPALKVWEWGAYLDAFDRSRPQWGLFLLGWVPSTGEAEMGLLPLFGTGSRSNLALYSNPRVDSLLDEAASSLDPRRSLELYAEVQRLVAADAPWIFLYVMDQVLGLRSSLQGVEVYPTELVSFTSARLVEGDLAPRGEGP